VATALLAYLPMSESVELVAVALPRPAAATAIVAAWEAGEAVLALDPDAPAPELARVMAAARPTQLLDRDGRSRLRDGEPVEPGVAAVVATSGTSGAAKAVELGADAIGWSARAVSSALGAGPGDRWLCCLPVHGVAGLAVLARAWHTGLAVEVHERFDPGAVRAAAGRATLVSLVPTMLRRLLAAGSEVARFRRVLLGGGPIPGDLLDQAAAGGVTLVRTYGLTETFGGAVHDGHPLEGVELRLAEGGEILVRGPMLFRRYRGDPGRTAAVLRDGWLRTGDLGRLGPDARLTVLGRRDELVISGGVNVHPDEVEAVLAAHPAVAEVAVAGRPDPEWGQRVAAFVVPGDPTSPPTLAELRAFALERLAPAKAPRELILVPALPRSPSGKLQRRLLPAADRHEPATTSPAGSPAGGPAARDPTGNPT
jgi:o-succinylbenzoate---CoA ligase